MSTRRALLGVAAIAVTVPACGSGARQTFVMTLHRPRHPDAKLLALCAQLEEMQAEWQRLWVLTSDGPAIETDADRAWENYADNVWPGVMLYTGHNKAPDPSDIAAQLVNLPATTPEGMQAKAAAILALDEAAGYQMECRNDSYELLQSLLLDVAGSAHRPLGAEAPASRTSLRPVPLTN